MLYKDNTGAQSLRRPSAVRVATSADWQAWAIAAYHRSEYEEVAALRAELAARHGTDGVSWLGGPIPPHAAHRTSGDGMTRRTHREVRKEDEALRAQWNS